VEENSVSGNSSSENRGAYPNGRREAERLSWLLREEPEKTFHLRSESTAVALEGRALKE